MEEEGFTGFACPSCGTEIEATLDLVGQQTECPACGAMIVVPEPAPADGIARHSQESPSAAAGQAIKSRTIRIELGDI